MPYYVIQVFSGKEEETIRRMKNELGISLDSFDFFVPKRKRIIKKAGPCSIKMETLFPGYIFIESNEQDIIHLKKALYQVKTLTKLLGIDTKDKEKIAYLLPDEESFLNSILGKENPNRTVEISHISLTEGKKIIVIDGPLKGFLGKIKKVNLHKRKVTIETELMGNIIDADLGIDFIEEVE